MADNSLIPVANSGTETFANKDIGGVKFPKHILFDSTGTEVVPATQTTAAAILAKLTSDPSTATLQTTGNTTLASILAKLTSDPATQTTLAAILAKLTADPSTETTLASILTKLADPATQTTLAAVLAKLSSDPATQTTLASVLTAVQAATPAGTNLIGKVQIGDGTNSAAIKAGSTAAANSDPAVVVAVRRDSIQDLNDDYEVVAANQTDQVLGATGAAGDVITTVYIIPLQTTIGSVSIKDGGGSSITLFDGGSVGTKHPIPLGLGWSSVSGAWSASTGGNVSVLFGGRFT